MTTGAAASASVLPRRRGLMVLAGCVVVVAALFTVLPTLRGATFCILDCAYFYDLAQHARILDKATYFDIEFLANRARPATILMLFPAHLNTTATQHYWFQGTFLLAMPMLLLFVVLRGVTGRWWCAALAVACALCNPSITENYYTLFKAEPWMLTGVVVVTFLLWWALCARQGIIDTWGHVVLVAVGAFAAMGIFLMKEPGGAFVAVYVVGTLALLWGTLCSWRRGVAAVLPLSVIQVCAFALLVYAYLRLPVTYNASGIATYSLKPADIVAGVRRVGGYVLATAPYLVPAMLALLAGIAVFRREKDDGMRAALRARIGWCCYFLCVTGGMFCALVPWQDLDVRQYLVGATMAPVAAAVAAELAWSARRGFRARVPRAAAAIITVVTIAMLLAHSAYAVMVGHLSEGHARMQMDAAYNAMFRYVAAQAPTNAMVSFLMDWRFPEPQRNAALGLQTFYHRPDVTSVFPRAVSDMPRAGLVVVSDYSVELNYNRMPLQHEAHAAFIDHIGKELMLSNCYQCVLDTPIWFATNIYHGPQYDTAWGVPAFWNLKRGTYRFGWRVNAVNRRRPTDHPAPVHSSPVDRPAPVRTNLIDNATFADGLAGWRHWNTSVGDTSTVTIVRYTNASIGASAVRIRNPGGGLAGVQQIINLESGKVYRIGAAVRSMVTTKSDFLFGARLAVCLPPQAEQHIVWMSECTMWLHKELVFTNMVSGKAIVYAHMGFGKISSTGEFTDVRLEQVGKDKAGVK